MKFCRTFVYLAILLAVLLIGCTGGEKPAETVTPTETAAPTTAPPTTAPATPAPTTPAPEVPAIDMGSLSTTIEDVVPGGGEIKPMSSADYQYEIKFPTDQDYESRYTVDYPDKTRIYVVKLKDSYSMQPFYEGILTLIDKSACRYEEKTLSLDGRSLRVDHKYCSGNQYKATITESGIFVFYLRFLGSADNAETYLKENMDYLFE